MNFGIVQSEFLNFFGGIKTPMIEADMLSSWIMLRDNIKNMGAVESRVVDYKDKPTKPQQMIEVVYRGRQGRV